MDKQKELKTGRLAVYYAASFLQGICLIVLPAGSLIFKSAGGNAITNEQYGLLFLPFIGFTILCTAVLGGIIRRFGEKKIYYLGLVCNAAYFIFLYAAFLAANNNPAGFWLLFGGEMFLGAGFGLLIAVLNILVVDFKPSKRDPLLTGLHGFLGAGAAICPLLVNFFFRIQRWPLFLILCAAGFAVLLAASLAAGAGQRSSDVCGVQLRSTDPQPAGRVLGAGGWFFLLAIVFYGVTESVIGNWTATYLGEWKKFSAQTVSYALACFWGFVTVGRVMGTLLTWKIDARILYRILGPVVIVSLFFILRAASEADVLFWYILLGAGCSSFFPLTISLSTQYHEEWRDCLSGWMVGGLMVGVGIGSTLLGFFMQQGILGLQEIFVVAASTAVLFSVMAILLTHRPARVS